MSAASVRRSFDGEFLNRVVNDPAVLPYVSLGLVETLDMRPFVADERNYFLANEWGGFLLLNEGDGVYDLHSQFLPQGRGIAVLQAAADAQRFMFTETDCMAVKTFCPQGNPAAKALARRGGFTKIGPVEILGIAGDMYILTRHDWRAVCPQPSL